MKRVVCALIAVSVVSAVWADLSATLEQADQYNDEERYSEGLAFLSDQLSGVGGTDRAEIYWRMARAKLNLGADTLDTGDTDGAIALYEEGEAFADEAISADPTNALGYYWKSANIGRWGQAKGVLNSLFRAPDMRDLLAQTLARDENHADSYYVLGQLYEQVPGVISFGNKDYAVSLGRLSLVKMEEELASGERDEPYYDFHIQLAAHLIARDWNARRRERSLGTKERDYRNASTPMERGFFYEGIADIPDMDDREEARLLLQEAIDALRAKPNRTPGDDGLIADAEELLNSL